MVSAKIATSSGEVAEWSNVPDSKSGVRFSRTVGSNPTLSASQSINMGLSKPESKGDMKPFKVESVNHSIAGAYASMYKKDVE